MGQIETVEERSNAGGRQKPVARETAIWFVWLCLAVALFFWKVLFTSQFSILHDWEGANQGYSWHQFAVSSFQRGIWPTWDPYAESGHSFVGEMQTGLFYPLKFLLYRWPLPASGILSTCLWHEYYVLAHLLAAFFMFLLARELGVTNPFAAFVAGICFGLGGFLGAVGGHQLWDSAVWLPLVFFFLLRALRCVEWRRSILYACTSGLSIALAILAGGLHISMMDSVVVASAAIVFALQTSEFPLLRQPTSKRLLWSAVIVLVAGLAAFAAGAVQLLPSMEYAPLAMRWGSGQTLETTPYATLTEGAFLLPRALLTFLFGVAPFGGEITPYFGVLPLLLAIIGAWEYRRNPWVKYAAALVMAAFLYALAPFSLLHGVLYLVPFLYLIREAGRFVYLIHFGLAILVGFGAQALFGSVQDSGTFLSRLARAVGVVVGIFFLVLAIPTMYGKQDNNDWFFFSFLLWLASWGVLLYVCRGHRSWKAQFLLAALILFDLHGFNWTAQNRMEREKNNAYSLGQLMAAQPMADFFKRQPGLFRVHVDAEYPTFVNLGDMFGVQSTRGQGATALRDYTPFTWFPRGLDLLNVRYIAVAGKQRDGQPIYTSGPWKVYENPTGCPRAWVVHQAVLETSVEKIKERIQEPGFDLLRSAFVSEPIPPGLLGEEEAHAPVDFSLYEANRMELTVHVNSPGLLVLSEMHYPGWEATVNGNSKHIYKVDGLLRGLLLDQGENRIVVRYRPRSILLGAALSVIAFSGTSVFAVVLFWKKRDHRTQARSAPQ